jgi:plasmid maintenance system killer protein
MVAVRKLDMPDAATQLSDLWAPPGNRLEALKRRATRGSTHQDQ